MRDWLLREEHAFREELVNHMNRFTRTIAVLATALVVLTAATGCWSPKQGPGLSLDKQLDKIVAETGITQAHEIHIFVGYLTIFASYQGKTHRLSLWEGELKASEVTDSLGEQLRGSAPLSEFDTSALIEQYKQLDKETSDCTKPKVTELIALTGAHIKDVNCSDSGGNSVYRPGSTTVDGQPVIDSPDLFNPHDVATMAADRAKVIPDNGAITSWTIWPFEGYNEFAFLPRTTTIAGGSCLPALATSGVSTAVTYIYCYSGESDAPADPNAPKPPTFRLSDYDPNLVNIAAQHIKEESGIDITQPMPIGYLTFTPANDGTRNLTWTYEPPALTMLNKVTGTITPLT